MPASLETPALLSERPLQSKLISELRSIATAMGLDPKLNKAPLLTAIQKHMKAHPEIADDPRFLPLFAHRSRPTSGGKNSAGKTAEEAVEASKPPKATTGANKTLLELGLKSDPPAQFGKLFSGGQKPDKTVDPRTDSDTSDTESPLAPSARATPEPEFKGEKVQSKQEMSVQVNFFDELDHAAAPRQVLLDAFPVIISTSDDGKRKYSTLLSELIPAAIKNDSPIKGMSLMEARILFTNTSFPECGGRVYRPNIRSDPAHHHLGKMEALLAGEASALKPRQMDEYTLRPSNDGIFECDIFLDHSAQAVGGFTDSAVRPEVDFQTHGTTPGAGRLKFAGKGSDIPVYIAADRAKHDAMHKNAAPGVRDGFAEYLHSVIKAAVPDIPDFGDEWIRSMFAGQMLDRYLNQEAVFTFLSKWSGAMAGYMTPKDHGEYSGQKFRKDFVYDVINVKSSTVNDTDTWFSPELLENAPKAKAWVESKGKINDSRFRKMRSARFKEYLLGGDRNSRKSNKTAGSSRSRVRRRSSSASAGPSRKHHRSATVSSSEEQYEHSKKSGKGKGSRKGKGKALATSEDMDDE
ncbi:hypothetical protein B0H17DRAFT_1190494 [Mycena rosella]|uniref:Uncharacterized protein n=1 Tax=Mycena rosella TaxID=1033263 RepID=A0AAD7H374_MYCRO|nr:hypothetical protein B0H17DRAFT_1190494 [Mycena rosella]